MEYNKLVRNRIPEILKEKGINPQTHIADGIEFWEKLRQKLQEEVSEFLEEENPEELADILEVIIAICNFKDINREDLENIRKNKAEQRGSFDNKIILEKT